jgi:outer membrane receptor for ferrienterochelin and colicins
VTFSRSAALVLAGLLAGAFSGTPLAATPAVGVADTAAPAPVASPASAPATPSAPAASAPGAPTQRIEITGSRSDEDQRRRATAAKIVVGRDEIEAFGDGSIGEVLRRLPGVTTPGGPGRGGAPRLRGLGSGYTRLLIDGEPIPRGFSLEQLTPEQVERIEILRAPTAETGARAIAGTINIVLREGQTRRVNDLRLGLGVERGERSPGLFWTFNEHADGLTANLSGALFERRTVDEGRTWTCTEDAATGELLASSREARQSSNRRRGLNLTARLQWRLGAPGDTLTLTPSVFHADNAGVSRSSWQATEGQVPYELARGDGSSRFTVARLNGQWRQLLAGGARLELGGNASRWQRTNRSVRDETVAGAPGRRIDDAGDSAETRIGLRAKWSLLAEAPVGGAGGARGDPRRYDTGAGVGAAPGAEPGGGATVSGPADAPAPAERPVAAAAGAGIEHGLVGGVELELQQRRDARRLREDGQPLLADFGDTLQARSTRAALYLQDEWSPSPTWGLYAGLRWEGIETVSEAGDSGDAGDLGGAGSDARNRVGVWTPLAHAVWRPDPGSRSQLRASLTRSWRAPTLASLIARPSPNTRYPLAGPNEPTAPDRVGNPDLRPELASGIDLAWEVYPAGGGVLSASLFHRRIRDLMRSVTTLETVPWSPVPRWVARTRNVGSATTTGVELEAKGRLAQLVDADPASLPRLDLRASVSLYDSRVAGVRGPDNRLDRQPGATANLGADWSPRGWPVKLGGNLNWVPAYRTQVDATQRVGVNTRRIVDAYALWTLSPSAALRLQAGNLAPRDSEDFARVGDGDVVQTTRSLSPSAIHWQLRLELKL